MNDQAETTKATEPVPCKMGCGFYVSRCWLCRQLLSERWSDVDLMRHAVQPISPTYHAEVRWVWSDIFGRRGPHPCNWRLSREVIRWLWYALLPCRRLSSLQRSWNFVFVVVALSLAKVQLTYLHLPFSFDLTRPSSAIDLREAMQQVTAAPNVGVQ